MYANCVQCIVILVVAIYSCDPAYLEIHDYITFDLRGCALFHGALTQLLDSYHEFKQRFRASWLGSTLAVVIQVWLVLAMARLYHVHECSQLLFLPCTWT